ncbi:MAG: hypothetical protein ACRDXX_20820 [Stackebrandtia sp.]
MRVRAFAVSALAAVVGLSAGCQDAGGDDPTGHSRLIDELSSQVAGSAERSYHAEYQVGDDGTVVTVARSTDLGATAYQFPKGRYVVTPDVVLTCVGEEKAADCVVDPSGDVPELPPPHVIDQIGAAGFVTARAAVEWLAEANAAGGAVAKSRTTTIAGENATCVSVTQEDGAELQTCITDTGLLGSFESTIDGEEMYVSLKSYSKTVDEEQFDIPDDAETSDGASG